MLKCGGRRVRRMLGRLSVVSIVLGAALAGCASPAEPAAARDAAVEPLPPVFTQAVAAPIECMYSCYEPSIAVDDEGRIFLTDGITADVAVSSDGGASWTARAPPPIPAPLFEGFQTDALVQTSPDGRLYYSALLMRAVPGVSGAVLEAIQVAASDDGGATWAINAYLSPAADPTLPIYSPDRQWLGFGGDGTMYLTYNQIPTGIWIARSDDGGAAWSGWTRAVPAEARDAGFGQSGPPVVDADGAVHVPACAGGRFGVFTSADGGSTFTAQTVPMGCNWFPILAIAPSGALVAAAQDGSKIVVSHKHGEEAWTDPVVWGKAATAAPWPLPGPAGALAVAWYEDGGKSTLHVTYGTLDDGPERDVVAQSDIGGAATRTSANTDFAHAARLAEGSVGVVWADGEQAKVFFARETSAESGPTIS